jgi:predicted phosphodiesterase
MLRKPEFVTHIGAIGNIHTEDASLDLALSFLSKQSLDRIVCVGDIVTGPGNVDRCCELLQRHQVITVADNHDRWFLDGTMPAFQDATDPMTVPDQTINFLKALPKIYELRSPFGAVLLCHSLGTNDMADLKLADYGYAIEANLDLQELIQLEQYRYVVNGHTHRRMVRHFGDLTIINAGTLRSYASPGFAMIDFEASQVGFYEIKSSRRIVKADAVHLDR